MTTEKVDNGIIIKDYLAGFNMAKLIDVDNHNKICFIYNTVLSSIQELDHFRDFEDILVPIYKTTSIHSKEFNMSMAIMINFKRDSVFEFLRNHDSCFKILFEEMTDYSLDVLTGNEKIIFIDFLINCYQ